MRIASLLPSATEIAYFADAGGALVGEIHECDYPPGVKKLSKLTEIFIDHHKLPAPR